MAKTVQQLLDMMEELDTYSFATVDAQGFPRVRIISALHFEPDAIYFYTARGKNFARELDESDGRLEILAYSEERNDTIRLSCIAERVPEDQQRHWIDVQFTEQSYLYNVYPGETNEIGVMYVVRNGEFEWFNLASKPITRECVPFGAGIVHEKGFRVDGDACISCGTCEDVCPQHVVHMGAEGTYVIDEEHCLHCGNCFEHCPVEAIGRLG